MKWALVGFGLIASAKRAHADGSPQFTNSFKAMADALDAKPVPVQTPLLILGGGKTLDGTVGSVMVGYGWGEKDTGGLFASATITRVLLGVRAGDGHPAMSLTYGWYVTQLWSAGFDAGVEATRHGVGPTTRITVGVHGVALRFAGGVTFEPDPSAVGSAELVLDVADLVGKL